jgi:hypothetical protein
MREVRRCNDISDTSAIDNHGGALSHNRAVENMVRRNGVQPRPIHLVRVIFCKWRGRSTLMPRLCATRIAKA